MSSDNQKSESAFDTDRQYLGGVYARALLAAADEAGQTDAIMEELDSLVDVLERVPGLRTALEAPRISVADRQRLIDKALGGRASQLLVNFVKVVTAKGRADCLGAIRAAAEALCDERAGRVRATMVTAQAADPGLQQKVAERLGSVLGKQVVIASQVDPAIIGGLIVRVGDTVYDGSLRNQLNQVRSAAINRANQEIRNSLDRFASSA